MAQVSITIDGKAFRMACDDGQERHLEGLAAHLDERIKSMRQAFGEIGDLRLTVMAALMICDELHEAKQERRNAETLIEARETALQESGSHKADRDRDVAAAVDMLAGRVDRIVNLLAGRESHE